MKEALTVKMVAYGCIFYGYSFRFCHGVIAGSGRSCIYYNGMANMVNAYALVNMPCKTDEGLVPFNKLTDHFAAHMYPG